MTGVMFYGLCLSWLIAFTLAKPHCTEENKREILPPLQAYIEWMDLVISRFSKVMAIRCNDTTDEVELVHIFSQVKINGLEMQGENEHKHLLTALNKCCQDHEYDQSGRSQPVMRILQSSIMRNGTDVRILAPGDSVEVGHVKRLMATYVLFKNIAKRLRKTYDAAVDNGLSDEVIETTCAEVKAADIIFSALEESFKVIKDKMKANVAIPDVAGRALRRKRGIGQEIIKIIIKIFCVLVPICDLFG